MSKSGFWHDYHAKLENSSEINAPFFLDKGNFCWHCHTEFSYPCGFLSKKKSFNILGENSSDYTSYYSYDEAEEVMKKDLIDT